MLLPSGARRVTYYAICFCAVNGVSRSCERGRHARPQNRRTVCGGLDHRLERPRPRPDPLALHRRRRLPLAAHRARDERGDRLRRGQARARALLGKSARAIEGPPLHARPPVRRQRQPLDPVPQSARPARHRDVRVRGERTREGEHRHVRVSDARRPTQDSTLEMLPNLEALPLTTNDPPRSSAPGPVSVVLAPERHISSSLKPPQPGHTEDSGTQSATHSSRLPTMSKLRAPTRTRCVHRLRSTVKAFSSNLSRHTVPAGTASTAHRVSAAVGDSAAAFLAIASFRTRQSSVFFRSTSSPSDR